MRIALGLAVIVSVACAARMQPGAPVSTSSGVRFVMTHDRARAVAVAGTFNEWSATATPLARGATPGVWTATVPLPPGDQRFMYVIDGSEWLSPPHADEYEDDGFGAKNGVISVRPR
jgi:1,4-alpha-glucan branching enzyme